MGRRFLVTGAAGFAGSHIVEEILQHEDTSVVALDCLTYAGRLDRLAHLPRTRIKYVHCDFSQPLTDSTLKAIGDVDYIIHNGAESHVARSFQNPRRFVESNVLGTMNVLQAARKIGPERFLYVSTDEVFGPAKAQPFREDDMLNPTNPYAATKAGGELLAYSYYRSFGLPVIITRTMNMFGERQHPEKCVPLMIKRMLAGQEVYIHGKREDIHGVGYSYESGSRNWLHARAQANALMFLLQKGTVGEKYNIAGVEKTNLEIYKLIASELKVLSSWEWADAPEPVHDFSYALDDTKIRALGWRPSVTFEQSFLQTVRWTAANPEWLEE